MSETQGYIQIMREQQAELVKACAGLGAEALNWRPIATDANSIYALAMHTSGSAAFWIHQVIGGVDIKRNRDAEFVARGDDLREWQARLEQTMAASEEVLRRLNDADLQRVLKVGAEEHTVRWCILHVIEHYNEHLGQMRLTRQLWENRHARPHEI